MFCSTIIPTIGRSTLSRAVQSVLDQTFTAADFEIIVVNDSGQSLPEAAWQKSEKVQVINTNRREKSIARNTGAAIAQGEYLYFLDDDDWLLPEAFNHFWTLALAHANDEVWLYGGARLLGIESKKEVTIHLGLNGNCFVQAITGEWIPLQASLIKTELFFSVGGFNNLLTIGEDKDLSQRCALRGNFAYTPAIVTVITRRENDPERYSPGLQPGRREREKVLDEAGAFSRMRASANSGYWHGRLIRIYLISTVWNLQHRRILTAISRIMFGIISLVLAGKYLFAPTMWQALATSHTSRILYTEQPADANQASTILPEGF